MNFHELVGFVATPASTLRRYGSGGRRRLCTVRQTAKPTARPAKFSCLAVAETSSGRASTIPRQNSALLLVDHGSKRAAANEMLTEVAEMLRAKSDIPVYTAHMEIVSPTIADGMQRCVEDGAMHVIVVPFFLSPGRHSTTDIPNLAAEAAAKNRNISYEVRPPIGTHPGIVDVILDRAGLL